MEEGYEIWVDRSAGKYRIIGENGAEFIDGIASDDIIFNHEQSKQLLKNGHINSYGKPARADGQFPEGFSALSSDDILSQAIQKMSNNLDKITPNVDFVSKTVDNIGRTINNIINNNASSAVTNNTINISMPNVTNGDNAMTVMNKVAQELSVRKWQVNWS